MTPEVPAAIPKPGWKQKWGRVTPGLVNLLLMIVIIWFTT